MSLVARAVTNQRIKPTPSEAGAWVEQTSQQLPFLSRDEIVGLAGLRALLGTDTSGATSTWLDEGKHNAGQIGAASVTSLVRARMLANAQGVLDCGAPSPLCTFASDWSLRYSAPTVGGGNIAVTSYRTRDNGLVNADAMKRARDAAIAVLADGLALHTAEGMPETAELVEISTAYSGTKQEMDYLDRLSDEIRRPLVVSADGAARIAAIWSTGYHHARQQADDSWYTNLAGGREGDNGSVWLRRASIGWELVVALPDSLLAVEQQRSYRAALAGLKDLAFRLRDQDQPLSTSIEAHVTAIAAATARPDRHTTTWVPARSQEVAGPSVEIVAGRWYPIGLRVITDQETNYYSSAVDAQEWVALRKRTFTRGFRAQTREDKRIFTARRPGLLINAEKKRLPYIRYASHSDPRDEVTTTVGGDIAWFWEVKARKVATGPGVEAGGLLLVSGWSRRHHRLAYGEELFAMMRAFASVVLSRDPNARIQTLYLAT
jgi:hypothetical protein